MGNEKHMMPAVAVKSIASGLCMMAIFTIIWAGIAFGGLFGTVYKFLLLVFPALSLVFIVNAIALFRIAKLFPALTSAADIAEEKRVSKWFGVIFGAEGLGIFIGINIADNMGHPELHIPIIALVVGLHFYPMAKIFKRNVDYYLATWSTVIAGFGIVFTLNKTMPLTYIQAFLGIGLAVATSGYGIYMLGNGRKAAKMLDAV